MESRTCTRCKQPFPATTEYFYRAPRVAGLTFYCKTCTAFLQRKAYWKRKEDGTQQAKIDSWPSKQKRYARNSILIRNFGITIEDFEDMTKAQDNKCVLCNEVKYLVVDHSHTTGVVRGLLCIRCNVALASLVGDNPDRVDRVKTYLLRGIVTKDIPDL